jgi:hypothetical protein
VIGERRRARACRQMQRATKTLNACCCFHHTTQQRAPWRSSSRTCARAAPSWRRRAAPRP